MARLVLFAFPDSPFWQLDFDPYGVTFRSAPYADALVIYGTAHFWRTGSQEFVKLPMLSRSSTFTNSTSH